MSCDNKVFYQMYDGKIVCLKCDVYDTMKYELYDYSYLRHFLDKPFSVNCRKLDPMY
jgi:hypothetical protein